MKSQCILFDGTITKHGYGMYKKAPLGTGTRLAHRVAYMQAHGCIPTGKCVVHTCDNRACINPDHLAIGTTDENSHHNLTDDEVRAIRQEYRDIEEISQRKLAAKYNVSQDTVSQIVNGHYWMHINQQLSG